MVPQSFGIHIFLPLCLQGTGKSSRPWCNVGFEEEHAECSLTCKEREDVDTTKNINAMLTD